MAPSPGRGAGWAAMLCRMPQRNSRTERRKKHKIDGVCVCVCGTGDIITRPSWRWWACVRPKILKVLFLSMSVLVVAHSTRFSIRRFVCSQHCMPALKPACSSATFHSSPLNATCPWLAWGQWSVVTSPCHKVHLDLSTRTEWLSKFKFGARLVSRKCNFNFHYHFEVRKLKSQGY